MLLRRLYPSDPTLTLTGRFPTHGTSSTGYLAIYLLGVATGLYTLPPLPTFFRTMTTRLVGARPSSGPLSSSSSAAAAAAAATMAPLPPPPPADAVRRLGLKRAKALGLGGRGGGGRGTEGASQVTDQDKESRKKAEWLASAAVWMWGAYAVATYGFGARVSRRLVSP